MCYEIDFKSFRRYILYPICKEYSIYFENTVKKYEGHPNFIYIENIANQLFNSRIIFFDIKGDSFSKFIKNMELLQSSLESEYKWKASSVEIWVTHKVSLEKSSVNEDDLTVAVLKLRKGLNIRKFISDKNINLLQKQSKKKEKDLVPLKVDYNKKLNDVNFYTLPITIDEFLDFHECDLKAFSDNIKGLNFSIKACERLIHEVEREIDKENKLDYFFD